MIVDKQIKIIQHKLFEKIINIADLIEIIMNLFFDIKIFYIS